MDTPEPRPPSPPSPRLRWGWLFISLFGPLVLTVLSALLSPRGGDLAPSVSVFGGIAGGWAAGILLGCHTGKRPVAKAAFSVIFGIVLAVVCVTMNTFGCLLGGYPLNFH